MVSMSTLPRPCHQVRAYIKEADKIEERVENLIMGNADSADWPSATRNNQNYTRHRRSTYIYIKAQRKGVKKDERNKAFTNSTLPLPCGAYNPSDGGQGEDLL